MINEVFEKQIFFLLNSVKMLSTCKDKQVAAIATKGPKIIGVAYNTPFSCNGKCDHSCKAIHAESMLNVEEGCTVWLNLFPCEDCQKLLYEQGVRHIIVFNEQHKTRVYDDLIIECKPNICKYLLAYNGEIGQKLVAAGECAELITAITDTFRDDRTENMRAVQGEIVDVVLQMFMIADSNFLTEWVIKLNKLKAKFIGEEE